MRSEANFQKLERGLDFVAMVKRLAGGPGRAARRPNWPRVEFLVIERPNKAKPPRLVVLQENGEGKNYKPQFTDYLAADWVVDWEG